MDKIILNQKVPVFEVLLPKFFDFKTIIPCHYRTFPILEQSADELARAVPSAQVIEPEILQPIML